MASLRHRLTSGARWTISIRIIERVIGFVSTLILARLLVPADFGVVAMGTAIQGMLAAVTQFGFTQALIKMRRPAPDAYSTAFTLSVITGVAVALAMLLLIPLAGRWYDDSRVAPVLATLAAISLITGFRNTGLTRYERALDFRPFFKIALARKLASFSIGAACALLWGDFRALLAGMLLGAVVEIGMTHWLTRFRPRFTLARTRELLGFSIWWLASQAAGIFGARAQDLVIGQQMGAAVLGKYSVALDLATLPTAEVVAPVMRAVYPGYMQMKDEPGRLYSAFSRVWGVIALLSIPSAVGIACIADLVTSVVLGPKWAEAAPLMGLLATIGAMQALSSCYWPMLLTRVGPRTVFLLTAASLALVLPAFTLALVFRGVEAAIVAWICCSAIMLLVGARILLADLGGSWLPLVRALWRPALGAVAMAASLMLLDSTFPSSTRWVSDAFYLVASILVGATVYVASVTVLWLLAGRPREAESELFFVALAQWPGRRS
jgi:O-antigen/teichoic acid export membrane protein